MKIVTKLTGTAAEADCSAHPIRHAMRNGVHCEMPDGTFRFVGVWDKELHLHHGREIVAIPLAELWKLAETAEPKFLEKPAVPIPGDAVPKFPIPPGMKQISVTLTPPEKPIQK